MTLRGLDISELKAKGLAVQAWWDKPINPQSGADEDVAESAQVIEAFRAAANHVAIGELIALLEEREQAIRDAALMIEAMRELVELEPDLPGEFYASEVWLINQRDAGLLPLREATPQEQRQQAALVCVICGKSEPSKPPVPGPPDAPRPYRCPRHTHTLSGLDLLREVRVSRGHEPPVNPLRESAADGGGV